MSVADPWSAPVELAGYRWRARRPRAALLLQHGYAEHARRYVEQANRLIPALTALGIDVFAFDMAGHGASPGRRGDTDLRRMVDAHLDARRTIAREGLPVFLFGHSLGGLVTAGSVAHTPDAIAGIVLSAPALPQPLARPVRMLLNATAAVAPLTGVSPRGDTQTRSRIDAAMALHLADPLVFHRRLPARIAATALRAMDAVRSGAARWRAPTLIVHGTADRATDPRGSQQLIEAIGSHDATLDLVADGRHELLNDLPRDEVLARILAWIAARLPEGPSR